MPNLQNNIVIMAMKVLHNSCNMCTLDLTDMYALTLWPVALELIHTYQSNQPCTRYNHNLSRLTVVSHAAKKVEQVTITVSYLHE